jgi:adenosylhomocysteinase
VLIVGLANAGARIFLSAANPLYSKNDVIDYIRYKNIDIKVFVNKPDDVVSFYKNMDRVLDTNPQIITDDGGELHKKAIFRKQSLIGGTEETTSGVNQLRMFSKEGLLTYPIIAVNESNMKQLLDNRFGTGQSTIEGIVNTTGIIFASKRIVVCGYGWVGKGVAKCARGMGAKVTITEVDPLLAIEAFFDGFEIGPLEKLLSGNDIFITCTGQINVIGREHFIKLKDKAILCNAGHFDVEIDVKYLNEIDPDHFEPKPHVTCYNIDCNQKNKKRIYVITNGRVVNLVGAEGNSPEVMDISFSNQFLAIVYLSKSASKLSNRVYKAPKKLDIKLAHLALARYGLEIDRLSPEQLGHFSTHV